MGKLDPPKFTERFFRWFSNHAQLEELEGDLYELFEIRLKEKGPTKARFYYLFDMLSLLRPTVIKSKSKLNRLNNVAMGIFTNYLKTMFRTGRRRAWYSAINLFGLTMGISSILFILLFINDELKYDAHISTLDSKFRIYNFYEGEDGENTYLPIVPPGFTPALKENFPQIEKIGRLMFDYGGTVFHIGEKNYSEKNGVFAEKSAIEILDIEIVSGGLSRMDEPKAVLLSEKTFNKFFGDVEFNNQTIVWDKDNLQVLGIYKNLPEQSHLKLDYIFTYEFAASNWTDERANSWVWQQFYTYVQLVPGTDYEEFQFQIQEFIVQESKSHLGDFTFAYTPYLQPIKDIHLHSSNFEWDIAVRGNFQSIIFLSIAALIILLIACLNFVNLTTAQSIKRAKEVCVRKFIGASRAQLILQYGLESTLYTLLAGFISALIIFVLLPYFNEFADKTLLISEVLTLEFISVFVSGLIVLGIVSGAYPAIIITSFNPLMAVQGSGLKLGSSSKGGINSRQILVASQYILSISLIILSLIIHRQFDFLQNTDMGFNKENLVVVPITRKMRNDAQSVKEKISNHSSISNMSLSYGTPGGIVAGDGVFLPDLDDIQHSTNMFIVDEGFLTTMGITLLAGRNFNPDRLSDIQDAFIINETAVKNFGFASADEAIGNRINWNVWGSDDSLKTGSVIGVVNDFNFKSLHTQLSSAVLHLGPNYLQTAIIKVKEGELPQALDHLKSTYNEFEPSRPFDYSFIDETFKQFYNAEERLNKLFTFFTFLAIITAGIGLFGLVSFNIISRSKEISIRKVLGASINSVVLLLIARHFLMGLVCVLIASPIAYYFAEQWLQNFAFAIEVDAWVFIEVTMITLLFTAATVGFQAYRGASANPATKLRSE